MLALCCRFLSTTADTWRSPPREILWEYDVCHSHGSTTPFFRRKPRAAGFPLYDSSRAGRLSSWVYIFLLRTIDQTFVATSYLLMNYLRVAPLHFFLLLSCYSSYCSCRNGGEQWHSRGALRVEPLTCALSYRVQMLLIYYVFQK